MAAGPLGQGVSQRPGRREVVLDQFVLGVFGSTVPQALAAGKPVVASYDETKNSWAFPAAPPLCRAGDAGEIAVQLRRLFEDPGESRRLAAESRVWFHQHHSPDRVLEILTGDDSRLL